MPPPPRFASTGVNPASPSILRAVCSPHIRPRPIPPSARETVMQCILDTVYRNVASGCSTVFANAVEGLLAGGAGGAGFVGGGGVAVNAGGAGRDRRVARGVVRPA